MTRDEFFTSFHALGLDSDFRATFSQLIDLSLASEVELGVNDLSVFYRVRDPFAKDARRALYAQRGSTSYVVACMFQGVANNPRIATFDSLADALSWIELKPSALTRDLKQWLALSVNSGQHSDQHSARRHNP